MLVKFIALNSSLKGLLRYTYIQCIVSVTDDTLLSQTEANNAHRQHYAGGNTWEYFFPIISNNEQ